MRSEKVCDYCKQKTPSLFGMLDEMVCSKCYARLVCSDPLL